MVQKENMQLIAAAIRFLGVCLVRAVYAYTYPSRVERLGWLAENGKPPRECALAPPDGGYTCS